MIKVIAIALALAKPPSPSIKRLAPELYEVKNPTKTAVVLTIACGNDFSQFDLRLEPKTVDTMSVSSPDPDLMPWCTLVSWKEIK